MPSERVHVVHLVYRFAAGGLENVIVQLINGLPHDRFRHTVVALTTVDTGFAERIEAQGVELVALHKPPGQPFKLYPTVYRLLKRLKPDVLHTCNIAALEFQVCAWAAGVPLRVHAEHGWDVADPDGSNRKYQLLRKIHQRFVHRFVVVSNQLQAYLLDKVGIAPERVLHIPNGVDTERFRPWKEGDQTPEGFPFVRGQHFVIGTVGRLEPIKNQPLLAKAFVALVQSRPEWRDRLRLAIVGAGPLEGEVRQIMTDAGLASHLWMPGVRRDVPEILRSLDVFVLPSLSEGTSCTLQEALATDLAIVATEVGGNSTLLEHGHLGKLVPSMSFEEMAKAIEGCLEQKKMINYFVRSQVVNNYSLNRVLQQYTELFLED